MQRKPINDDQATKDIDLNICMSILFQQQILLSEIKRVDNEEDKLKIQNLKKDVFSNMSIVDICNKYGLNMIKDMKKVKTTKNICLFRFRTEQVNSHVHNLLYPNQNYFIVGKDYICKEHHKQQGFTLHTNYTYKLKKFTAKEAILYDETENKNYTIDSRILIKKFKQPYALTCDSIQGLSFDKGEAITIFDSNTDYCDRRYLWVAITRCRALKDVNLYIHSESEVNSLKNSRLRLYHKNKIIGYKHQDT